MADSEDGAPSHASTVPSYARPNVTSRLPEFSNQNNEAIRAAFQPNNFRSIQGLNTHAMDNGAFRSGASGATAFSEFAYVSSPYDLGDEAKVLDRHDHEDRMRHIGGDQPFFAGYNAVKLPHEQIDGEFEYAADPYSGAQEARTRERWLSESRQLSKPFLPAGVQKALSRPSRAMLGDAMTALHRTISEDWPEAQPTVLSTAEDLIVVYFVLERIKNPAGVNTYMNNALRRNEAVVEYDLRKVAEGWSLATEDNHLMFTFRPPWVRPRAFLATAADKPAKESAAPDAADEE
jgi:hypothetical protein